MSDTTMDTLLESLENVIDEIGDPGYEVEYSVCTITLLADEPKG